MWFGPVHPELPGSCIDHYCNYCIDMAQGFGLYLSYEGADRRCLGSVRPITPSSVRPAVVGDGRGYMKITENICRVEYSEYLAFTSSDMLCAAGELTPYSM